MSGSSVRWALGAIALLALGAARAQSSTPAASPPPRAQQQQEQAQSQAKGKVEKCAVDELGKMSDFLAQQKQFTVRSQRSMDVVENGQRKTLTGSGTVSLQRPDKLRIDRKGDLGTSGSAWYDGKEFSVMQQGSNYYAKSAAPPTIDELLDQAEDALGWIPPGADLLVSNPKKELEPSIQSGQCLGETTLDGTKVKRVAFEGPDAKWELAIEDSNTPLPRQLIILPKDDPNAIRYTLTLSDWNLSPKLDASTFKFTPPKGAERIAFLRPPGAEKYAPAQGRKGAKP